MHSDHTERGRTSRARLRELAERLTDEDLGRQVDADWTASGLLAHVAFWDRYVVAEWEKASRDGVDLPPRRQPGHTDVLNAANAEEWRRLPPRLAVELAIEAAERFDAFVAGLDESRVVAALGADRRNLVDRSKHRNEHVDAIEGLLAGPPRA